MNNEQRVAESLELLHQLKTLNQPVVSPDFRVLAQDMYQTEYLRISLIGESKDVKAQDGRNMVNLAQQIARLFNKSELRVLCMSLGEDLEDLEGEGKADKCLSLVDRMRRHGRLPELLELLTTERLNAIWPAVNSIQPPIVTKPDLAVVVATAGRVAPTVVLLDVACYLDQQQKAMDANYLFFQAAGQIPVQTNWNQFPRLFNSALNEAYRLTGAKRAHFFLAGPGPILFSFGCMWSTVKQGLVYHKGPDTYHPVITISHDLFNAE